MAKHGPGNVGWLNLLAWMHPFEPTVIPAQEASLCAAH
jgi:hypothetical protein